MSIPYKIVLGLMALVTLTCASVAIYAWHTHFEWERTGAYANNSFPMGSFAETSTLWAVGCAITIVLAWVVASRRTTQS